MRLHKLVRRCGLLDRTERPNMTAVLAEVKSIYDTLTTPGLMRHMHRCAIPRPGERSDFVRENEASRCVREARIEHSVGRILYIRYGSIHQ